MDYKSDVDQNESNKEAINRIINARDSDNVVVMIGDCKIHYEGRAWSYTEGRHSVIINPSGSVVVHNSESVKPKNWQPSDAETRIEINEDDEIIVISNRTSPEETLTIRFSNFIKSIHYNPSDDNIDLRGSEKDVHKYICDNPSIVSEDFSPKQTEESVMTGDIDVFGENNNGEPVIVEVKRKKAQQEDVGQLRRYVDTFDKEVDAYLVAPDITDPARSVLENKYDYEFVEVHPSVAIESDSGSNEEIIN